MALGILLGIFFVLLAVLLIWFCAAYYPDFDGIAKETFNIQGLEDGISPQGICTLPKGSDYDFAMSGYMVNKSPSRVYFINSGTNEAKYITLTREGEAINSHFGGVTATKKYLLVADGTKIVRVPLEEALAAKDGEAVEICDDELETGINAAFCFYQEDEDLLFVGEFYRWQNYKTDESHHLIKDGETNYAFVYAYEVDDNAPGGVKSETPKFILSVRGLVQGIAVTQNRIYLSCSYGLPDSHLYVYSNPVGGDEDETIDDVPLYRLDKNNLETELVMPCMSEEICVKDGRLYILFESMCDKYKYFVRVQMKKVIAIPLELIGA